VHTDVFNDAAMEPIDLTAEFERAAGSGDDKGDATGESAGDPAPESEITIRRRRRTRERSQDAKRSTQPKCPEQDRDGHDPSGDDPTQPRRRRGGFWGDRARAALLARGQVAAMLASCS
jgi:hypothetical protein